MFYSISLKITDIIIIYTIKQDTSAYSNYLTSFQHIYNVQVILYTNKNSVI